MKTKFEYVGIRVTNLDKSIEFYTGLLGMRIIGRSKMEQTKGETVGLKTEDGSFVLELNYYEKDSPYYTEYNAGDGLDHMGFKVDGLDKALEEAEKAGYPTILSMKSNDARWAYIQDPDGNWIELY